MTTQREPSRRWRVIKAVRASGDFGYLASSSTLEMLDRFWLRNILAQPRWKRIHYRRYEWKAPSGVLHIFNWHGAWAVHRDGVPLVNAFDGREVLFFERRDAENAAFAHACDGQDGHRQLNDELCWEPEEEDCSELECEID
jgi:hypothetical protein